MSVVKLVNIGAAFEHGVWEEDEADEDGDVELGEGVFTLKWMGLNAWSAPDGIILASEKLMDEVLLESSDLGDKLQRLLFIDF